MWGVGVDLEGVEEGVSMNKTQNAWHEILKMNK